MKYAIDSDGATDKGRLDAVERGAVQTSTGTLVFLDNNNGTLAVKWTAGRTAVDGTLTAPTGISLVSGYSTAICRDAADNLYVFGISTTAGSIRSQAYAKGAGNTWTKQTAFQDALSAGQIGRAVWCNTGGGTGGAGHILVFFTVPGLSSVQVKRFDAGALLAGTGSGMGSGGTIFATSATAFGVPDAAQDGFGATSGITAANTVSSGVFVDSWSVNSSGTITNANLTTQTTAVGGTAAARVVRYASNAYAVVYQSTTGAGRYRCARYSGTAQLTAGTDSGAPTSMPLVSNSSRQLWDLQVDPNTANTVRVFAQDTAGKVWSVTLSLAVGVTWGGTATAETGTEAATQTVPLDLRTINNPEYSTGGAGFGDWHSRTSNAALTNYLLDGDYRSYNVAPNAPTLTAPANASTADLAAGGTFTATNNDPDLGDTVSAYALRRKISGAGSYEYWNATTAAWQAGIVWNSSASLSVTFGAGKWTNGNVYNWSFAAQDAAGAQGPFATDNTVTAQTPPTVTVTAPTGTITTATPTVTWTDTLASGKVQTAYQVIVESGAYGTSPGSGTQVYDSGTIAAAGLSHAIPVAAGLVSGTAYRFFVRVTQTGAQVGPWNYSTATVSLTPPSTPSLVATAQPSSGRVKLDVTAGAGGPGGTYYLIERSADGGSTWTYVRTASPLTPLTYAGTATVYDYEAPPGVALLYRVTTTLVSGANTLVSAHSATAAATLTLTSAWLKDPLDPARNVALSCLAGVTPTRTRTTSVLLPLGATYPVVQVDARRSRSLTIEVTPSTQAEADAVEELLDDTAAVLLLQRPQVDSTWRALSVYFVVSGDDSSTPLGDVASDVTTLAFPATEVATPALA